MTLTLAHLKIALYMVDNPEAHLNYQRKATSVAKKLHYIIVSPYGFRSWLKNTSHENLIKGVGGGHFPANFLGKSRLFRPGGVPPRLEFFWDCLPLVHAHSNFLHESTGYAAAVQNLIGSSSFFCLCMNSIPVQTTINKSKWSLGTIK